MLRKCKLVSVVGQFPISVNDYSQAGRCSREALLNQCIGWCCIDRSSWQR